MAVSGQPVIKNKNMQKTKTSTFSRTTIAPNLEQLTPKLYRARVSYKGKRYSVTTTNKTTALQWIKQVRTTGKTEMISKKK